MSKKSVSRIKEALGSIRERAISIDDTLRDCFGPNKDLKADAIEAREGIGLLLTSMKKISHSVASGYRNLIDPIKPRLDKVVDSTALFTGLNLGLSLGIHTFNQYSHNILTSLFGSEGISHFDQLVQSNTALEIAYKVPLYGIIYGIANFGLLKNISKRANIFTKGVIGELTKRVFKRETRPSWPNHLKTWAIAGAAAIVLSGGISGEVSLVRRIDNYLSGKRATEVVAQLQGVGQSFIDFIQETGYEAPSEETRALAGSIDTIVNASISGKRLNKDFPYNDRVSQDTKRINKRLGCNMSPEQIVYLSRLIYFEGGFDRKAGNNINKLRKGMEAISSVILNRYYFDNASESAGKGRYFDLRRNGKREKSPFGVGFKHGKNRFGSNTWQFTCIRDHPTYFYEHEEDPNMSIYGTDTTGNPILRVGVGKMNKERADIAYNALVDVLLGRRKDSTKGSLFYMNPRAVDKNNSPEKWRKRGLTDTVTINSHLFFTYKNSGIDWQKSMNLASLNQEKDLPWKEQYGKSRQPHWNEPVMSRESAYHKKC